MSKTMNEKLIGKTLGIIHSAVFTANTVEPYCREIIPEVEVLNLGDDSIQRENLNSPYGTIPKINYLKFSAYCHFMELAGVDLIMLSCSAFSQAARLARPMIDTPILNIDQPMMELAVKSGNKIGLVGTLKATMPFSENLLNQTASNAGKPIEVIPVLCEDAFAALRRGDKKLHNEMLLDRIDVLSRNVDAVVLAQVSMSALEGEVKNFRVPVFNSARTGFERAREMLENAPIKSAEKAR